MSEWYELIVIIVNVLYNDSRVYYLTIYMMWLGCFGYFRPLYRSVIQAGDTQFLKSEVVNRGSSNASQELNHYTMHIAAAGTLYGISSVITIFLIYCKINNLTNYGRTSCTYFLVEVDSPLVFKFQWKYMNFQDTSYWVSRAVSGLIKTYL